MTAYVFLALLAAGWLWLAAVVVLELRELIRPCRQVVARGYRSRFLEWDASPDLPWTTR